MLTRLRGAVRALSTSSRHTANEAVEELRARFPTRSIINERTQLLDVNQARQLAVTLGHRTRSGQALEDGDLLPPGYHLVYFTPNMPEAELGADGTDKTVNPSEPFTRRMWAGGEMRWSRKPHVCLRIGQSVQETTRMLAADVKAKKSGPKDDMIVVKIEKTYETDAGVALIDERNWIFQQARPATGPPVFSTPSSTVPFPTGPIYRDLVQTPVSLFRFSALTFNAHKIHYSLPFNQEVEGHRGLVVHGPLNIISILDLWATQNQSDRVCPNHIKYRAKSPVYAEEPYRILLNTSEQSAKGGDYQQEATIMDSYGNVAMSATLG